MMAGRSTEGTLVSELGWPSGAIKRMANGLGWPKSERSSSTVSRETSARPEPELTSASQDEAVAGDAGAPEAGAPEASLPRSSGDQATSAGPATDPQTTPEINFESRLDSTRGSEPEFGREPASEPGPAPETEPAPEPEKAPESGLGPAPETESAPEAQTESAPKGGLKSVPETELELAPEPGPEVEPVSGLRLDLEPSANFASGTSSESQLTQQNGPPALRADHVVAYSGDASVSEQQPLVDADPEYQEGAQSVAERQYATADAIGSRVGPDLRSRSSALPEVRMSTPNEPSSTDSEPSTISVSVTRPWLGVEPTTGFRNAPSRPAPEGAAGSAPVISPATGSQPLIESISLIDESTPLAVEVAEDTRRRIALAGRRFPRPRETRVITVSNQKGGVGKTTSTVNMAGALALAGLRVLVLDIDPQGNASTALGIDHHAEVPSVYDVLVDSMPLEEAIQPCPDIENLWCAPATIDLAGAEIELVSLVARESRLQRAVTAYLNAQDKGEERLDYILIDCPPSLGLLTVNAFVAAHEVLIPIQCEYYALEGLSQLLRNVELIKGHLNPALHVSTILLTMYDGRTRLSSQVADEVRAHFPSEVLKTTVPRSVRISEAPSHGQTVMTYDPTSSGALSYLEAARELAEQVLGEDSDVRPTEDRA
jgi:chromosome partitioning protein